MTRTMLTATVLLAAAVAARQASSAEAGSAKEGRFGVGDPKPVVLKADRPIYRLAWSPDGRVVAGVGLRYDTRTNGFESALTCWELGKGGVARPLQKEGMTRFESLAFSPDGKVLAVAANPSGEGKGTSSVRLVDPETGAAKKTIPLRGTVRKVVFSPDGKALAIGGQDLPKHGVFGPFHRTVRLWDVANEKAGSEFRQELKIDDVEKSGQLDGLRDLVFSPDGKLLAAADVDFRVRLIDAGTGRVRQTLEGHSEVVLALAFSPDGKTLASGGFDRTARVWDARTGKELRTLKGNTGHVWAVAFSPDGKLAVTGGAIVERGKRSSEVILWDAQSWQPKRALTGVKGEVGALAFSPDGKALAVGGAENDAGAVHVFQVKDLLGEGRPGATGPSQGQPGYGRPAERAARITVGRAVQVSKAYEKRQHAEVILAAAPNHHGSLLAGSMVMTPGMGPSVVVYASRDGGSTWTVSFEKKAKKGGASYADPAVAFGPDGTAYFAALPFQSGLEITPSRDGGRKWEAAFVEKGLSDRPFLAADCTDGRFRGRLYCFASWGGKLAVHRSRDGARTFDPPVTLTCEGSAQGRIPGQGAVLSDGTLVLPYRVLTKATDRRWSLRLQRSDTGGESFLGEQVLRDYQAEGPESGVTYDMPTIAADPGSPAFKDRLYLVWSELTGGGMRVMAMVSADRGASWSRPTVLSDQPASEEGGPGARHHAFLPAVAVNRAGVVAVSWYVATLRERTFRWGVRLRASLDGGSTWLGSVGVTDVASSIEAGADERWLGDTAGLAADHGGTFHPLWIDKRTGVKQVFTAPVVVR